MKKTIIIITSICVIACSTVGCGNKTEEAPTTTETTASAVSTENAYETETGDASSDDDMSDLEALGDVEVDKGLFDVTLTIPAEYVGDTTQEELDANVKENGYQSATLNDDGSATFIMTKSQHKKMMDGIKEGIDGSLSDMIGSENYPNITDIKANDDYTSFTVTTKSKELDLGESMTVLNYYMFGGMYAIYNGTTVDNIHVDFVNADSGEIIDSSDSKDME